MESKVRKYIDFIVEDFLKNTTFDGSEVIFPATGKSGRFLTYGYQYVDTNSVDDLSLSLFQDFHPFIMSRYGCSPEESFHVLNRVAVIVSKTVKGG